MSMNTLSDKALIELEKVLPSGALRTDASALEDYSKDESEEAASLPEAVAFVRSTQQVSAVMAWATKHRVPVTPRAGGSGRSGGAIPVHGGVVLAFEKMNTIKGIEAEDHRMVVEPGVILGEAHRAAEAQGFFYPPDPNSLESCCVGGNIAENAGGPRAFKYGVTRNYVLSLETVMPDGTVVQVGRNTLKGVTGYDVRSLLVGSEGTLGLITEVNLRVIRKPQAVRTVLTTLPTEESIQKANHALFMQGVVPRCAELLDYESLQVVRKHAKLDIDENARAMILFELDGDEAQVDADLERVGNMLEEVGALQVLVASDGAQRETLWAARRKLSFAMREQARFKIAEDVVVPRSQVGALLRWAPTLAEPGVMRVASYGHVGDGNIHVNLLWDDPERKALIEASLAKLFAKVVELGGTLTGEHGVGLTKAPYLALEQSHALIDLQKRIKTAFDPLNILNPGKIFSPLNHHAC